MVRRIALGAALAVASIESANIVENYDQLNQPGLAIEVDTLPAQLPAAVQQAARSVLSIEYGYSSHTGKGRSDLEYSSAVRIAPDQYLSAGHSVKDDDNSPKPFANVCGNLIINGPSDVVTGEVSTFPNGADSILFGSTLEAIKHYGSYIVGDTTATPDISIIEAPDAGKTLPNQSTVSLAPNKPKVGENVYFINYQPIFGANDRPKHYRSPSESEVTDANGSHTPPTSELTKPAFFGGVVTSISSNGDIQVITGLKSYDTFKDKRVKPGSSGGEVVNAKGQMIGQSIQSLGISNQQEEEKVAQFDSLFNLNVRGALGNAALTMANVQPVSKGEEKELQAKLKETKRCINDPSHILLNP